MNDETKSVEKKAKRGEVQHQAPPNWLSPFDDIDHFFENYFPRGWMRPFHWEWPSWGEMSRRMEGARIPRVDVIDQDDAVTVRAEVPGVDKKDLDVSATENTVTIKGKSRHEQEEDREDFYRCEISRGEFARTVGLPAAVDADKVKTRFKDGMLELTLPKITRTKRRKIKVD